MLLAKYSNIRKVSVDEMIPCVRIIQKAGCNTNTTNTGLPGVTECYCPSFLWEAKPSMAACRLQQEAALYRQTAFESLSSRMKFALEKKAAHGSLLII